MPIAKFATQVLHPLAHALGRFNYIVSLGARNLAGALLGLMLLFILAQVGFRLLGSSLPWTEEMSKFAMVWVACLVAPWAYRENLNVSIQMFAEALPPRLRLLSEIVITCLVALIATIFLLESIEFWRGGLTIYASSVAVKLAYFYACAPFAFAGILLVAIEKLLLQLSGEPPAFTPSVPIPKDVC